MGGIGGDRAQQLQLVAAVVPSPYFVHADPATAKNMKSTSGPTQRCAGRCPHVGGAMRVQRDFFAKAAAAEGAFARTAHKQDIELRDVRRA